MDTNDTNGDVASNDGGLAPSLEEKRKEAYYWMFVAFGYTEDTIATLIRIFSQHCRWYMFQEEKCPKTGNLHLQGTCSFLKKVRWSNVRAILECWWKPTKSIKASILYCQKELTRAGRQFMSDNIKNKKTVGKYKKPKMEITEWMKNVITYIESERDNRSIMWIWDKVGGKGKTQFCKYLLENYNGAMYFTGGKANDITYQIIENSEIPELCLFDLPRSTEGKISYNALEQLKNGLVNSSKYKGGFKTFDSPHVVVFANFEPDYTALSTDRWKSIEI